MNKFFVMFVPLILFMCLFVFAHELTHQRIFAYEGIKSEIKIDITKGAYVLPERNCSDTCRSAQYMNDVIADNLMILIAFFVIMFIVSDRIKEIERRKNG